MLKKKGTNMGAGEIDGLGLRTLAEDPGSIFNAHIAAHNHL